MDRARVAYLLTGAYIGGTSLGAFFLDWRAGFIVLGVTSGHIGYLLGKD